MDNDYLIKKWLNGDLTAAEKQAFDALEDSKVNNAIIDHAQYFKASHFTDAPNFEQVKDRLKASNTPKSKVVWLYPLLKIASVLLIFATVYFSFFYESMTQVKTLAAHKTTISLPDNSQVVMNAMSEISYSKVAWKDQRQLNLDGEALFTVAKGTTFDVITKDGVVTVVGTVFNVKQRDDYFEVYCFEGTVNVRSHTTTKTLRAGDTFKLYQGAYSFGTTPNTVPNWTKNMSTFDAIAIKDVLAELERQYHVEVTYKDINPNRLFTGGFTHDNLENALISITQPMALRYELQASKRVVIYETKD